MLHSSLDAVEEQLWNSPAMSLGVVDRFNNLQVGLGAGTGGVRACALRRVRLCLLCMHAFHGRETCACVLGGLGGLGAC